jgi:benzaldehyde dehydrogenase (NAD)
MTVLDTHLLDTRIPSRIVHINDQTVGDEAVSPFGALGDSGTGSRLGGLGNQEAFTETQSLTIAGEVPPYPF